VHGREKLLTTSVLAAAEWVEGGIATFDKALAHTAPEWGMTVLT